MTLGSRRGARNERLYMCAPSNSDETPRVSNRWRLHSRAMVPIGGHRLTVLRPVACTMLVSTQPLPVVAAAVGPPLHAEAVHEIVGKLALEHTLVFEGEDAVA